MEGELCKKVLNDIFGDLKKIKCGNYNICYGGGGDEFIFELCFYEFGDKLDYLVVSESLCNVQINYGIDDFKFINDDFEVWEIYYQSQMSMVLMIDILYFMIFYGEDCIIFVKKVVMVLSEYIIICFLKDILDIIVFGNDVWFIEIKDLLYL